MEWSRGNTLARGSTATVSIATTIHSPHVFAVKSADLHRSEHLKKEQEILSTLNSPQIVAYKGCDVTLENGASFYNIFMEYAPLGTLADAVRRHKGGLSLALVARYTHQMLLGLKYLHSQGIVHCDVKGQNILVTEQGAKIADFGYSRRVAGSGGGAVIAGTPAFMAPEVARGEEQGFPADVWALGCTVLETITGQPPWYYACDDDPVTVLYRIGFSDEVPEIPSHVSEEGRDFLAKCFKREPCERWSVEELLGHRFVYAVEEHFDFELELGGSDLHTPMSVLDPEFWEKMETEQDITQTATPDCCCSWSPVSPRDRIRGLCGDDTMMFGAWQWDDGWISVRSNEVNEFEGCSSGSSIGQEPNGKTKHCGSDTVYNTL
ncbi:hypothetical protein PIB30_012462 [Stylosanthes scabra]|uniref:Protein kinase domain-containing protein n=1 Tax=Stylosanthes scabra TaxID=79078 RepID=A0ABU6T6H4_9FABA|nr:hypothetical protein [Stylosanthes scabra]